MGESKKMLLSAAEQGLISNLPEHGGLELGGVSARVSAGTIGGGAVSFTVTPVVENSIKHRFTLGGFIYEDECTLLAGSVDGLREFLGELSRQVLLDQRWPIRLSKEKIATLERFPKDCRIDVPVGNEKVRVTITALSEEGTYSFTATPLSVVANHPYYLGAVFNVSSCGAKLIDGGEKGFREFIKLLDKNI